jgi:hypothetical protein
MLGMSADEIAPLREAADRGPFEGVLRRALWAAWLLRVQTRTQCASLRLTPPACIHFLCLLQNLLCGYCACRRARDARPPRLPKHFFLCL